MTTWRDWLWKGAGDEGGGQPQRNLIAGHLGAAWLDAAFEPSVEEWE
ncbi:MAG: hypothetical protein AAGD07_22245 [Planctomycetota bacterium]